MISGRVRRFPGYADGKKKMNLGKSRSLWGGLVDFLRKKVDHNRVGKPRRWFHECYGICSAEVKTERKKKRLWRNFSCGISNEWLDYF